VRGIYDHFQMTLEPAVERTMLGWLAANPQGKHGQHRYSLEEFGLTERFIRERFLDYIECYRLN